MCTNDRKLILSDGNDDGFIEVGVGPASARAR